MKWSVRLARVSGIDIRVHVTLALVLLLGAWVAFWDFIMAYVMGFFTDLF